MRKKSLKIIILLITVITLGVIGYWCYKTGNIKLPFFQANKTYTNNKYKISLNYPDNLILEELDEGNYYHYIFSLNSDSVENSCNSVLSLFFLENPKKLGIESFFDEFNKKVFGRFPIEYKNAEITQIGGKKAYFIEEMCEPCAGYCGNYYFQNNDKIYGLRIHKTKEELKDIIASFKFLE